MPGQSRYSRLALADAQQRYDVIGDLPSEAGMRFRGQITGHDTH